jgi:hypothetical protein
MLTIQNVRKYGPMVEAVIHHQKVRYLNDNGDVVTGTLRAFVPDEGYATHARPTDDLTKLWVRVTTVSGFDTWVPAAVLAEKSVSGEAAFE